jgi:hypothetical protein
MKPPKHKFLTIQQDVCLFKMEQGWRNLLGLITGAFAITNVYVKALLFCVSLEL